LQAEIASYKKKLEAVRSHPASRKHAFRAFFSGSPFTEQAQQQMGALQSLIDSKLSAIPQDDDRAIWLVTYEISQLRKAIAEYESALAPHIKREERRKEEQRKKQVQKQQIEELRAAAASSHEKTRELGARVRNRLAKQSQCPYCGGALGPSPHADHIYPVSKGGRSVERNMVMVCASCNIKKAHLTLSAFIKTYQLNRDEIEARLTVLEKDF
jgi:5-methylcytosine-specific restriction endonuclease McrA